MQKEIKIYYESKREWKVRSVEKEWPLLNTTFLRTACEDICVKKEMWKYMKKFNKLWNETVNK